VVNREVRRIRPLSPWTVGVEAVVVSVIVATIAWLTVHPLQDTVRGAPRAAEQTGSSDEDQIRDVIQAMTDAYNRKDVRSTEDNLCASVRAQWNPKTESAWLAYRLQHGAAQFTIRSVDVTGAAAHITGTQTYANDTQAHGFTAEMGRAARGWKMCSST
jgi:hypothetical protein